MTRIRTALIAAVGLALLAGCSAPGTVQAHALTVDFKPGDTLTYRIHVSVNGSLAAGQRSQPVQSDTVVVETLKVLDVAPDGTADLDVTASVTSTGTGGSGSGSASAPAASQHFQLKIARDGHIVSGGPTSASSIAPSVPGSDQITPLLPDHPVKVGDTWSRDLTRPNPLGEGSFTLHADSRYARDEKLGSIDTEVIQSKVAGPLDFTIDLAKLAGTAPEGSASALPKTGSVHYSGAITSDGTYWLDRSAKKVVKAIQTGHYTISYDLGQIPSVQQAGLSQIRFDGDIRTDITRT